MISADLITGVITFLLTLMIMSYLIGDNPFFRIAVHIFVGVTAGYVAVVAYWQVLWPDLLRPLITGTAVERALLSIPLVLSVLLLMKVSPQLTRLGTPAMAILVGVSAAVAIGGSVTGTLIPQVGATITAFDLQRAASPFAALFNGVFILVGVITTLVYFHFGVRVMPDGSVRRSALVEIIASIGSFFLFVTLGVLFAGVYSSALAALIDRLHFFASFLGLG